MKKLLITLTVLLAATTGIYAQNFRTGYFLDGYMYKYQLNPAFQGERGFIALPVIGGTSIGIESNLTGSAFFYPQADGSLSLFADPEIPTSTVLSNFNKMNLVNENLDLNLLAIGFRAKNTYHTLDFSLRENISTAIPVDVFRFVKEGSSLSENSYDFSSWSASVNAYLQAAYGFSIKIKDIASIGFRAKFLMGVQSAYANLTDFRISYGQNKYSVNAAGDIIASSMILNNALAEKEIDSMQELMTSAINNPSCGAAIDLGFSVDFLKHFTVSGAILDLGFISWKNSMQVKYGPSSWELDINEIQNSVGSNPTQEDIERVENELNSSLDDLSSLFNIENPKTLDKYVHKLGFTTLLGLEFRLPFYDRISIGALGTHRFEGTNSWTEGRVSLNYAPSRWFSLTGNYAISTYGESYGAAVNIHPKGLNIFLGVDSFKPLLNMTPQFIPMEELNTNVKFGVTFPFGKYNGRYPKKEKVEKNS